MDDKTVQRKLDQLTKIANELDAEAKRRYGPGAIIFYEAEGSFHMMSEDNDKETGDRQDGVRFSSNGHCRADCGAW